MIQQPEVISAEQRSREVQYKRVLVEIPESSQKISVSLGYRRCYDFDRNDKLGQDFAAFSSESGYVVGVVADGVSQSFYGEVAAQHVSKWLLQTLWENRKNPPHWGLEKGLGELETRVSEEIKDHKIPNNLPSMQIKALENIRKKGSQTVFAAFIFDGIRKEVYLYQVGDVTALVYRKSAETKFTESNALPKGRWSTAGKSKHHLEVCKKSADGILIKSDGVSEDWGKTLDNEAFSESKFQKMAEECARRDDVSYIAAIVVEESEESQSELAEDSLNTQNDASNTQNNASELTQVQTD